MPSREAFCVYFLSLPLSQCHSLTKRGRLNLRLSRNSFERIMAHVYEILNDYLQKSTGYHGPCLDGSSHGQEWTSEATSYRVPPLWTCWCYVKSVPSRDKLLLIPPSYGSCEASP
ncbi:hypothetical protein B0H19DRAFT_649038 [Mycena capillaripes]|nr:hypothetical protein B0H19DRAFT_649038 [Mycena capillaripes]